jgi:hypothetical protein
MRQTRIAQLAFFSLALVASASPAAAATIYNNDFPNDVVGLSTHQSDATGLEIEAADDFILKSPTSLTSATFTGLVPLGTKASDIEAVRVEIYRVFPKDSQDPPSGKVPTRMNSPSDVAFAERNSGTDLTFSNQVGLNNEVLSRVLNGNISVGGGTAGPLVGEQLRFLTNFTTPISLPSDHYFFVPQVQLKTGEFLWLSAPRPIIDPPGTAFAPDLQAWIRNDPSLAPDWLRVGTDIVGNTTFNAAFSVDGTVVPEPAPIAMLIAGLLAVAIWSQRKRS